MNSVQAGRLLTLAYFLKTKVPDDHFDMMWFTNQDGKVDLWNCGTTACALGWATAVFPDEFHLTSDRLIQHGDLQHKETVGYSCNFFGIVTACDPDWDDDDGDDPDDEWSYLFGQHQRTPKEEAEVIEKFVASKGFVYA